MMFYLFDNIDILRVHFFCVSLFYSPDASALCLHNLRKTFKYGGRKDVPLKEEIVALAVRQKSFCFLLLFLFCFL